MPSFALAVDVQPTLESEWEDEETRRLHATARWLRKSRTQCFGDIEKAVTGEMDNEMVS